MIKKIKTILLFSTITLSLCIPNTTLYAMKKNTIPIKLETKTFTIASKTPATSPTIPDGSDKKKLSWWKKTLIKGLILAAVNIVLSDILREILSLAKSNDVQEREKIESLITINNAIKNNMEYVRNKFKRNKVIKKMEQKFINSCSKIMDMHIRYLQKYGNKKNNGTKS